MFETLWSDPRNALQRRGTEHAHLSTHGNRGQYDRLGVGRTQSFHIYRWTDPQETDELINDFVSTPSWKSSWPMRTLWSGLDQTWWIKLRSRWGCRGSRWRRSMTWRMSWSAWAWRTRLTRERVTSLVKDILIYLAFLLCRVRWCITYFIENNSLIFTDRHVSSQRPVRLRSVSQGVCGGEWGGNWGCCCHWCCHEYALCHYSAKCLFCRPPVPLLHPAQPVPQHSLCWQILLPCLALHRLQKCCFLEQGYTSLHQTVFWNYCVDNTSLKFSVCCWLSVKELRNRIINFSHCVPSLCK